MSEENNTEVGPVEPVTNSNVINLADFRKNKSAPAGEMINSPWPSAISPKDVQVPVGVTSLDPNERLILLSLTHGDILLTGYLGLSQTFLAVGDSKGQIKFAAAPGMWQYVKDVTDDPEYAEKDNGFVEPDPPSVA